MKITTDKALIFSAAVLLIYTTVCIVLEFMGLSPDSTLTACIFVAFGVTEGSLCAFLHISDKKNKPNNGEVLNDDE